MSSTVGWWEGYLPMAQGVHLHWALVSVLSGIPKQQFATTCSSSNLQNKEEERLLMSHDT